MCLLVPVACPGQLSRIQVVCIYLFMTEEKGSFLNVGNRTVNMVAAMKVFFNLTDLADLAF